jgi:hypothetical protein
MRAISDNIGIPPANLRLYSGLLGGAYTLMRPFDSGTVSFTMAGELQVQRSDARPVDLSCAESISRVLVRKSPLGVLAR